MKNFKNKTKKSLSLLLSPPLGYMLLFFIFPIFILFLYSFWISENYEIIKSLTFSNYIRVFSEKINLTLIFRSVYVGLVVSFFTIIISIPVAYGLTFNERLKKYKDYFLFMILIMLFSSYLVRVYAWRTILGDFGIINRALMMLGIIDKPLTFLLYNKFAVIISLIHILAPFTLLPIFSSMQNINPEYLQASRDLGASAPKTFFRVTLPLCKPGLITAFIFSFILSAGDYVTPALLGGTSGLMIGKVIADKFGIMFDWSFGSAITFILLIIIFLIFFIVINIPRISGHFEKFIRSKFSNIRINNNKKYYIKSELTYSKLKYGFGNKLVYVLKKIPSFEIYSFLFLIFMLLPVIIIIVFSFNASRIPIFPFTGFSLKWYKEVLTDINFLNAIRNSFIIAFFTAVLAGIFGASAAFAFNRFKFRLKNIIYFIIVFPTTIPGLLLGISLLSFFTFIKLQLSIITVIFAHLVFTIPFVFLNINSALANFDISIEDAARDLGASTYLIFRKITFPIIKSALIGGLLIAFALSFDEFIVTFFVIGGGQNTVPMLIFSMLRRGISPAINAISSMVLIISFIFITIANRFTKLKVTV